MTFLNAHHVADLNSAGYEFFEVCVSDIGDRPGHIVVADPVLCLSGNKRWAEVRRVTLRSPSQVAKFIDERS